MVTSFLVKCRIDIEKTIDLPRTGAFKLNDSSARICYRISGEFRYINLSTRLELAELFRKNRIIHFVSYSTGEVRMFIRNCIAIRVKPGMPPRFKNQLQELKWNDIKLTAGQLVTIAAQHEMSRNKVIKMFVHEVFKTAA